jgi:hypothetical protein
MQPHERIIAFDLVGLAARLITVDKARVWREAIVASPVSRFRRQLGEDGWHRGPRRAAQRVTRVVAIASQSRDPAGRRSSSRLPTSVAAGRRHMPKRRGHHHKPQCVDDGLLHFQRKTAQDHYARAMLSRRPHAPIRRKDRSSYVMSSSVVKNDAKRVPPSREHLAHAMTHGNPIMTADTPHRAMMDGKHDGVALAERNDGNP